MSPFFSRLLFAYALLAAGASGETWMLSRAEYLDRVSAIWQGQMIAVLACFPFEHQTASTEWIDRFPKPYSLAPVDDDWYYEMCAIRAMEKHGIGLTAEQLGQQWLENSCGSWGSSQQALNNLKAGIKAPDSGHPRYNRLWFTIGPQFSADVYGALAPGLPNVAGRMAREYGHVNGYAEAVDGAVFMAAMVSLGFVEKDARTIVRKAALMIDSRSPYRQCLDQIISHADAGGSFEEIVNAVEDRWHIEYPATNNAVPNGGITAASVWFGEGNFWKTVNLAARAADFTDADCNAANAAAVIGAMHGMKALPSELVAKFADRIVGEQMGGLKLTPPVDEKISELSRRTVVLGEKVVATNGGKIEAEMLSLTPQEPVTQPAELFTLPQLMQYWNADWTLERAGFGGAGGGMTGIRGITYLSGETLATYPRDETRGVLLRRKARLGATPALTFEVGSAPNRAWELSVYAKNQKLLQQLVAGGTGTDLNWQSIRIDLSAFANQEVTLRLYQRVLIPVRLPGNAYWKKIELN
jgi:ADP-ribosylglycohydrolase